MPGKEIVSNFLRMCKGFDQVANKVKIISAGNGSCVAEFKIEQEHINVLGGLHGGFSATLVDVISGLALVTHERGETAHVSVDMHLSYLKSAKIGDEIIVNARTLRAGKNVAYLEVDIKNKTSDELLVKGSHTKYFLNFKFLN